MGNRKGRGWDHPQTGSIFQEYCLGKCCEHLNEIFEPGNLCDYSRSHALQAMLSHSILYSSHLCTMCSCLNFISHCCDKKTTEGSKGLFQLTIPGCSPSYWSAHCSKASRELATLHPYSEESNRCINAALSSVHFTQSGPSQ